MTAVKSTITLAQSVFACLHRTPNTPQTAAHIGRMLGETAGPVSRVLRSMLDRTREEVPVELIVGDDGVERWRPILPMDQVWFRRANGSVPKAKTKAKVNGTPRWKAVPPDQPYPTQEEQILTPAQIGRPKYSAEALHSMIKGVKRTVLRDLGEIEKLLVEAAEQIDAPTQLSLGDESPQDEPKEAH